MDIEFTYDFLVKFIRFGTVGLTGVGVDFGVTWLLKEKARFNKYLANACGFLVAASSNYYLNRIWTFHSNNPDIATEYSSFLFVSLIGLLINSAVLWFLVSKLKWKFYFSKLFAIGVATLWNFFANLLFTFPWK